MADEKKPKKSKKFTVEQEIEAVLEKHGYADWAVVCRAVDGAERSWWTAGDGENPLGDADRGLLLHGKMAILQASIIRHFTPKTTAI